MLEGSRLQPRDALDALQPTRIGHQPYVGAKDKPDGQTKNQTKQQELQEQKEPQMRHHLTFYTKRSHDLCTCGTVMSHMTSQCHRWHNI